MRVGAYEAIANETSRGCVRSPPPTNQPPIGRATTACFHHQTVSPLTFHLHSVARTGSCELRYPSRLLLPATRLENPAVWVRTQVPNQRRSPASTFNLIHSPSLLPPSWSRPALVEDQAELAHISPSSPGARAKAKGKGRVGGKTILTSRHR